MNKPSRPPAQRAEDISRRHFLRHVGAAGAALATPNLFPASVLGFGGHTAPSERIGMGFIGLGGQGTGHLLGGAWTYVPGGYIARDEVQVLAVCDVRKERRDSAHQRCNQMYAGKLGQAGYQGVKAYPDFRELLARPDIDAVLIAVPYHWAALLATMAMRAGKDVYCEKPSCLTMAQGKIVVETAKQYGRVYQTGAQRLSEPNHVFAIEMARTGKLGPIHTAYADCRYRGGSQRNWLPEQPEPPKEELNWDAWLGPCPWRPYNIGYVNHGWYDCHDFATDIAMWGAHTVAQALAGLDMTNVTTIEFEYAGPDATMATRLSNGVKLILYRIPGDVWKPCEYWHSSCGERFDGPEGWAGAADGYAKPDVSSPAMLGDFKKIISEYTARTHRSLNHMRDFLDCVRSRRTTVANPEVMFRSMSICLAADICEQLQRNMKFDLQKAEFIGDAEANRLCSRTMRPPWTL